MADWQLSKFGRPTDSETNSVCVLEDMDREFADSKTTQMAQFLKDQELLSVRLRRCSFERMNSVSIDDGGDPSTLPPRSTTRLHPVSAQRFRRRSSSLTGTPEVMMISNLDLTQRAHFTESSSRGDANNMRRRISFTDTIRDNVHLRPLTAPGHRSGETATININDDLDDIAEDQRGDVDTASVTSLFSDGGKGCEELDLEEETTPLIFNNDGKVQTRRHSSIKQLTKKAVKSPDASLQRALSGPYSLLSLMEQFSASHTPVTRVETYPPKGHQTASHKSKFVSTVHKSPSDARLEPSSLSARRTHGNARLMKKMSSTESTKPDSPRLPPLAVDPQGLVSSAVRPKLSGI